MSDTPLTSKTLLPCPFCGQPGAGPIRVDEDGWRVHCSNEPGQCVWPYFDTSRSPDAAVSMWNHRAATEPTDRHKRWYERYKAWYEAAIVASNEAGYAGVEVVEVIRDLARRVQPVSGDSAATTLYEVISRHNAIEALPRETIVDYRNLAKEAHADRLWLLKHIDSIRASVPPAAPPIEPTPQWLLKARAEGRAEFFAILLELNPEDFDHDYIGSHAIGDTGDYGAHWNEPELRQRFCVDDATYSYIDNINGTWWSQQNRIEALEEELQKLRTSEPPANDLPIVPWNGGYAIRPTAEAADAFWKYWRENGETHRHGYYESTWGAINQALRAAVTKPAKQCRLGGECGYLDGKGRCIYCGEPHPDETEARLCTCGRTILIAGACKHCGDLV